MQNVHPVLVHFPIGLLSVGLLCDILGSVFSKNSLRSSGWWCQVFGIAAIIAAALTGVLAESTVGHSDASHEIMEMHKTLGLVAMGIFGLLFLWRSARRTLLPQALPLLIVYFIVGASAVGLMFFGAHLGGRLVYEFGVGGSAIEQREDAGHHHSHSETPGNEAEHYDGTEEQKLIKDTISTPADTMLKKQRKIHVHKDGNEHTH